MASTSDGRDLVLYFAGVFGTTAAAVAVAAATGVETFALAAVVAPAVWAVALTRRGGRPIRHLWETQTPPRRRCILAAVATYPALGLAATLTAQARGIEVIESSELSAPVPAALAAVIVAVGEEPGWRAFALPRLIDRSGVIVATTVLGTLWWAWHLVGYTIGVAIPDGINPVAFAAFVLPTGFVFSWFWIRTRSVLVAIALHLGVNLANAFTPILPHSIDGRTGPFWIFAGLNLALALFLAPWLGRGRGG